MKMKENREKSDIAARIVQRWGKTTQSVPIREIHDLLGVPLVDMVKYFIKPPDPAIAKYRQQYREQKEAGWPDLPLVVKYRETYYAEDGQHRIISALLEGASSVLVRLEERQPDWYGERD